MTTHLRRKLALAGILAALAVPALSACGDTYATDRPNDLGNGAFVMDNGMRILSPRIVASADGQGILIGTIALNPDVDAATISDETRRQDALTGVSATNGAFNAVTGLNRQVNNRGILILARGGIPVSGTFRAGDIVPTEFTFANGEKATIQTIVVTDCDYNQGSGQDGWTKATSDPSPSTTVNPGPYDCAYPVLPPIG